MKSMTVWMLAALALAWTAAGCKKEASAPAATVAAPAAAAPTDEAPAPAELSLPVSGAERPHPWP